jgi:hypothetical protein
LSFTWSPHAKACAQVGAPLVAAAIGLTVAAIVCLDGFGDLNHPGADLADAAKVGFAAGARADALTAAGSLSATSPAWSRPIGHSDLDCLSQAVYYEARGESAAGQAAVAQVVLNRARDPAFPKSVCAVVFQPASDGRCQFSFTCDGSMTRARDPRAWREARAVAQRALGGYVMQVVARALSFHGSGAPVDARSGTTVARLGHHVFYVAAIRPLSPRAVFVGQAHARPATMEEADAPSAVAVEDSETSD